MAESGMKVFFDRKLLKFLGVGVANTLLSAILMFGLYRLAGMGYWPSSAVSYLIGAVFSFFLNKMFTFKDRGGVATSAIRFALTVAVCYLFSFSLAKPLVAAALSRTAVTNSTIDQIAMLVAMVLYTGANYVLQRVFVFRHQNDDPEGPDQ